MRIAGPSAGPVLPMALWLFCVREAEIESFAPRPYWTVEADAATGSRGVLTARLSRLDGAPLRDALATRAMADIHP